MLEFTKHSAQSRLDKVADWRDIFPIEKELE